MTYTATEKSALDTILKGFASYIQEQDYFDIVYSEKMGYLRILVESPEEGTIVLDTPEKMLEYLCGDVISDVLYSPDNPKRSEDDMSLTEYEKAESRRRLMSIFETLGMDKEHSSNLAEQHLKAYQGDEGDWPQKMAHIKRKVSGGHAEDKQAEEKCV